MEHSMHGPARKLAIKKSHSKIQFLDLSWFIIEFLDSTTSPGRREWWSFHPFSTSRSLWNPLRGLWSSFSPPSSHSWQIFMFLASVPNPWNIYKFYWRGIWASSQSWRLCDTWISDGILWSMFDPAMTLLPLLSLSRTRTVVLCVSSVWSSFILSQVDFSLPLSSIHHSSCCLPFSTRHFPFSLLSTAETAFCAIFLLACITCFFCCSQLICKDSNLRSEKISIELLKSF